MLRLQLLQLPLRCLQRRFRPPPSKTEYVLAAGELPDMLGGACREVRYLLMRSFGVAVERQGALVYKVPRAESMIAKLQERLAKFR